MKQSHVYISNEIKWELLNKESGLGRILRKLKLVRLSYHGRNMAEVIL